LTTKLLIPAIFFALVASIAQASPSPEIFEQKNFIPCGEDDADVFVNSTSSTLAVHITISTTCDSLATVYTWTEESSFQDLWVTTSVLETSGSLRGAAIELAPAESVGVDCTGLFGDEGCCAFTVSPIGG